MIVYITNAKGTTKGSWMRDKKKQQKWSGGRTEKWFFSPHPCDWLISLLLYQASGARTGFKSSSIYHRATMVVNLDYLLLCATGTQHYKYLSCLTIWYSNLSKELASMSGFTWTVVLRRSISADVSVSVYHWVKNLRAFKVKAQICFVVDRHGI